MSFTTTGANRVLQVCYISDATLPTLTYGGVSMTRQTSVQQGTRYLHLFTLLNPASGSNSFVLTGSSPTSYAITSYTGVGSVESFTTGTQAGSGTQTLTLNHTTLVANDWTTMCGNGNGGGSNSGGSNYTSRASAFSVFAGDNGPVVSPGAVTMTRSITGAPGQAAGAASARSPPRHRVTTTAPSVTTSAATEVTFQHALLNGNITADGGASITQYGFAYGTVSTLATVVATTTYGAGVTGTFIGNVDGLSAATTYYFRAYAVNSIGTAFGTILNFTTSAARGLGKVRLLRTGTSISGGTTRIQ